MLFTKIFTLLSVCSIGLAAPLLESRAVSRTSPPTGALVVRQGSTKQGEYSTISKAVASLTGTGSASIFIYPGTYNEQVTVDYKGPLTLYGYTTDVSNYQSNQVTVTQSIASLKIGSLDLSSTIRAHGDNFAMYNINAKNTYGQGSPALALYASGNKQAYYACAFFSFQDTVEAHSQLQYYKGCYFEGATDFIFGGASAWFEQCTIGTVSSGPITANGRDSASDPSWYVFNKCTIGAAPGHNIAAGSIYLGRPWRVYARVIYQYSTLSNVIATKGWTEMIANAKPTYEEFQNIGAGANTSQRQYMTNATSAVKIETLLGGDYKSWVNTAF